jgi:hypothetical protein
MNSTTKTDPDHTSFILNIVTVYVHNIHDALSDDEPFETLKCDDLAESVRSLDWQGALHAIITKIENQIASGDLPAPFEKGHIFQLAASRGCELEPLPIKTKGLYHLFHAASGTYLEGHHEKCFTEWQAYQHLLNLPPADPGTYLELGSDQFRPHRSDDE